MKATYFGQCWCSINIDENNYAEETELETKSSITLVRPLTISTGERTFGQFTSGSCNDTTMFNFAYMNSSKHLGGIQNQDQKSILDENSKLHEIDA